VNWTPPHHPGRGALALLALAVVLSLLALTIDASALTIDTTTTSTTTPVAGQPPAPPEPPAPDPSPHIRVLLARLGVLSAQHAVADQQTAATSAHGAAAAADGVVAEATQAQQDAQTQLDAARQQLGSTAAYAFMHAGGADFVAVLQGDSTGGGSERELFAASVDHHQQQVVDARNALADAGDARDSAQQADDQARQAAADQDAQVSAAGSALDDAHRELATAIADENRPTTDSSWKLSIEGPTTFTAAELAQWYDLQAHGSQATEPIADLAASYVDQGTAEGVRGDMAFAQSIHETGWFANNDTIIANNFAGIGHCSDCPGGFPFATPDVGVLAQIQLLKSYAEPKPTYNLPRADKKVNGPAGCCPTWTELGGVWASDTNYGPHILAYYAQMLEWLVALRSAAP